MSYIDHLNRFFEISRRDARLSSSHFSLYIALFNAWNRNRFKNLFFICSQEMMAISHIGSRSTFQKAITDLHAFGYIRVEKAGHRYGRSRISITSLVNRNEVPQPTLFDDTAPANDSKLGTRGCSKLGTSGSPKLDNQPVKNGQLQVQNRAAGQPKIGQVSSPVLGTHYKDKDYKDVIMREKDRAPAPNATLKKIMLKKNKDVFAGEQKCLPMTRPVMIPVKVAAQPPLGYLKTSCNEIAHQIPTLDEVSEFFRHMGIKHPSHIGGSLAAFSHSQEGEKFYSHYSANGWKLGGITPIINWQAAARKWILNCWHHKPPGQSISNNPDPNTQISPAPPNDYHTPL